jgi:hypothetical protein
MGLNDIFNFYVVNVEKNSHNPTIFVRISTSTESKSMKFFVARGRRGSQLLLTFYVVNSE